jgi:hypothetical protein
VSDNCLTPVTCASLTTRTTCLANTCAGTCNYDCDAGYHLEGSLCVPDVVALASKRLLVGVGL